MAQPIRDYGPTCESPASGPVTVDPRASLRERNAERGNAQERERARRARQVEHRGADLLATLALPFFVLGLVVTRLALRVAGRRRRSKPYVGGRVEARGSARERNHDLFSSEADRGSPG